ncbi:hypothetical protein FRC14_005537 [Serendipita sp. 396]|nr:hypothetical protein FRC14_005537 [Serendipita sp. 396]KAG8789282.1 hypothetical protein FRC15_010118 [Serendipita sp. 397]KAG8804504.1 hypothetical protein FRC16_007913 [Serendipita sp. 398]KAG8878461.1 hypothetical protein FRC20_008384 [Serendipita sp. 405]
MARASGLYTPSNLNQSDNYGLWYGFAMFSPTPGPGLEPPRMSQPLEKAQIQENPSGRNEITKFDTIVSKRVGKTLISQLSPKPILIINKMSDKASVKGSIRTVIANADPETASISGGKTAAAAYAERTISGSPVSPLFAAPTDGSDTIVLRSSDGYDFHVNRFILKIGSPPLGSQEQLSGKDGTLMLPEPACILDVLLTLLYPVEPPTWTSLDGFGPVLDAAIRYDMRGAIETLRQALISPRRVDDSILPAFSELDPIRVYAIARQAGLEPEAQVAGNATKSVSLRNSQMSVEVENMPTKFYRDLVLLRDERGHWRETFKLFKTKGITLKGTGGLTRSASTRSTIMSPSLFGRAIRA